MWRPRAMRKMSYEDVGRDWNDISTNQGMPKIAGHHQNLEERHGIVLPQSPQRESTFLAPWFLDF